MRPAPEFQRSSSPVRILLLEDDPAFAALVRLHLERVTWAALALRHAQTLGEAMRYLASESFDLVIADLNVADSSGLDTVRALVRAGDRLVLVLSGDGRSSPAETVAAGAYDVLAKDDVDALQLERIVRLAAMQASAFRSMRESEARKAAILDTALDAIVTIDARGCVVEMNTAAERQFGYRREDVLGREMADLIVPPELRDQHRAGLARAAAGGAPQVLGRRIELPAMRADGGRIDVELAIVRIPGTEPPLFTGTMRDITERKRSETLLRESEERFRSLTRLSSDMYWEQDAEYRFTSVSDTGSPHVLSGRGAMIGRRRWDREYFNMTPADWDAHRADLEARRPFRDLELARTNADGQPVWVSVSGEPVFDDAGAFTGYRGVGRDITTRKRAEEARRAAEADARLIVESAVEGIYRVDAAGRVVSANPSLARMLGYPSLEEMMAGIASVAKDVYVDPQDRRRYVDLLKKDGIVNGFETRWRRRDGSTLWVSMSGRLMQDPASGETFHLGTAENITERKREQHLLSLEHSVSRRLAEAGSEKEGVQEVVRAICETLGWDCGRYFDVDDAAGVMRLRYSWSTGDERLRRYIERSRDLAVRAGEGLVGSCWQTRAPLWIADISNDSRLLLRGPAVEAGLRAAFLFPLVFEGQILGVIALASAKVQRPDDRLLRALQTIGSQVGQFLQRKRAEAQLRESEARLRSLMGLSSDFYWETDHEHRVLPSTSRERHLAASTRQVGARRWETPSLYPDAEGWARHRADMEAHRAFRDFEIARVDDDGLVRWRTLSGEPVFDAAGAFKGYRGVGKDITARKREERLLALEHAVSRQLADARVEDEGVRTFLRAVCESEGWHCGRFFRFEKQAGAMRFAHGWSIDSDPMRQFLEGSAGLAFPSGEGLIGHAWQSGKPLWVQDTSCDARVAYPALSNVIGLHGAFTFPISVDGRVLGVVSLSSCQPREPDQRFLQTAGVLGSQLGQFLERTRTQEAVHRQAERMAEVVALQARMAGALSVDEICNRLVQAAERIIGSGSAALQFVEDGGFVYYAATPRLAHLIGVRTALQGNFSAAVVHSGQAIRCDDAQNDARIDPEAARRARAGSMIGAPLQHEGRVIGVLKLISEDANSFDDAQLDLLQVLAGICGGAIRRKQAERALAESETRFRNTFELAASGIAHVSLEGRYLHVNRRLCEIFGYTEEELVGRSVKDVSHEDDRGIMDAPIADLHTGRLKSVRAEKRYRRKDGSHVWVELTIALARDAAGAPLHHISIYEDITERKAAENALRRFRAALDSSADMVFLIDARDGRLLDFNGTACSYLGYERAELLGLRAADILHGLEQQEVLNSYQAVLAQPGRADSVLRRYRRKDGRTFEAEVLRRIIDSPDGPILVVNARDLTERNLAEERKAVYVRHQEELARFGAAALDKRGHGELLEDAVQSVLEALRVDAVAYVERGASDGEVVIKAAAGKPCAPDAKLADEARARVLRLALDDGELAVSDELADDLPFGWKDRYECAAFVPVHGDERPVGALCAMNARRGAFGPDEAKFLVTAASVLSAALRRIDSEGRLAFLAQFDALTGLPNRALLSDRFSQMIVQARRHQTQLGALFIDLDGFKLVNDTLGHAAGDDLLREVARRLQDAVRPGDTVARISGDEFAVVLGDLARAEDGAVVAQKILDRLAAPLHIRAQEVFVTASIGIAIYPPDGGDAESLLAAADAAMYRAKQAGRNGYQFFTAEINQRTRTRALLAADLRRALEREEFALAYQPKFDLRTGAACAVEALLRWKRQDGSIIPPAEFIPVLEESGLIVAVGEWVIRRACDDLKSWQREGLRPVPVAINLSARQFRQQDLDQRIEAIVREARVDPKLIELEITESQLMQDPDHAIRVVRSLHEAGMRIAIDDFGTGYSSLSYLTRFDVSALKIDRSFVADVLSDQADATIVRTIVDMAHTLGFTVVAEGVETEGQAAFLRGLGCEQAQGYLFARPMPEADFKRLLARN